MMNSTYYALPKPSGLKAMTEKTGKDFLFSIKANQEMTHRREDTSVFTAFYQVLAPMVSAGKLGCILAQFPYSFRLNRSSWDYLKLFRERLGELPVVVEFRNAQWLKGEVFDWLRHLDLGFCCVDEPQLPKIRMLDSVAEKTFIFANNHWRGQAVGTIRQLRTMLD